MALNDKNIIITPNIGSANNPKIDFIGASESVGASTITAVVSSANNGTLSFQASEGELLSITNNLTSGSIFSVNDVSGIPSIEVNANGNVSIVSFGSSLGIGTTNPTQKVDISGNLRLRNGLYDTNNLVGSSGNVLISTGAGVSWAGPTSVSLTDDNLTTTPRYLTFEDITSGYVSSLSVSSSKLVFTPSTGNLGIGTTNPTSGLHVAGTSLITGVSTIGNFIITPVGTGATVGTPGIVTYYGDGSELTGIEVAAEVSISIDTTNQAQYIPYVVSTGNVAGFGVTTSGLVFNPSTTRLGVGNSSPSYNLHVEGTSFANDSRINSVSEKSTIVSGNTVNLVYNTGGGNVAICTNPTGVITINVTGIPTDSTFDNRVITFTVVAIQTAIGYACTTVNLNGVSRTTANGFLRYPGAVVSTASTNSIDIFNFTGINTVGSGSTTANYTVLAMVNGNFKSS